MVSFRRGMAWACGFKASAGAHETPPQESPPGRRAATTLLTDVNTRANRVRLAPMPVDDTVPAATPDPSAARTGSSAKRSPARKSTATRTTPAKKAPAASPAATAKKTAAKKTAATSATPVKKAAPAKRATGTAAAKKAATAGNATTKKATSAKKTAPAVVQPKRSPDAPPTILADDFNARVEALDIDAGGLAGASLSHPSVAERTKAGKIARVNTPRESLAGWTPPADRPDATELLLGQETSRVEMLLPVRHARMATSAFAFYRGAAIVMASDLSTTPRTGLEVQLCGDAHLSNFGMFGAPDRSVVFDVNDFDETNPGPFEWDVKRLAASFVLAARDNKLPADVAEQAAKTAAASYRESMAELATMTDLDIWYQRVDPSSVVAALAELPVSKDPKRAKPGSSAAAKMRKKDEARAQAAVAKRVAKARSRDAWSAIEKITEVVDGKRQFRNEPPLLARLDAGADAVALVNHLFYTYRSTLEEDRQALLKRYEIIDIGHKVVGVGSVGLLAFVMLMRGRDDDDLMVLQVKQAQSSVLEPFTRKSPYTKHGHRVVAGQRLMQTASDSFLGWIQGPGGRHFYIRQLRDMKWSPDPATLDADKLRRYAALCGHTLARAHARSGDAVAISAYLGGGRAFDKAITAFAVDYADQMELDYAEFTDAIATGRIEAHEE